MKKSKTHAQRLLQGLTAAAVLLAVTQAPLAQADRNASVERFPGLSPSLLADLGGEVGLENIVDHFYDLVSGDNRINAVLFNRHANPLQDAQKKALVQTLMGTPSVAAGTRHDGVQPLTTTQYNALVEDLYLALDQARVSYHTSNRVMGSLVAYQPSLVSAYLNATPSVDTAEVRVGPVRSPQ